MKEDLPLIRRVRRDPAIIQDFIDHGLGAGQGSGEFAPIILPETTLAAVPEEDSYTGIVPDLPVREPEIVRKTVSFRLDPALHERLKTCSFHTKMEISKLLEIALKTCLPRWEETIRK